MYPPNQTIPSFDPYSLSPFWHGPSTGRYDQGTPLDSPISEDIKALTNYANQFHAITKAQYLELGNRLSLLEKKDNSPIINAKASEGVNNMDSDLEDTFSLAYRSHEDNFFYPTIKCSLLFLAEVPNLHVLWVVRLHLWMVNQPFKERMRIHRQLDIGRHSGTEFTPFDVNSLKFPCLPHIGKYLLPLILCRAQVWGRITLKGTSPSQNRNILSQPLIS